MNRSTKMKQMKNSIKLMLVATLSLGVFYACKKDEVAQGISGDKALVYLKNTVVEYNTDDQLDAPSKDGKQSSAKTVRQSPRPKTQVMDLPFGDDLIIRAEFTEDDTPAAVVETLPKVPVKQASNRAGIVQEPIAAQKRFSLLVYLDNALVDERTVTVGSESSVAPFELDGGKTYTFVAVSTDSDQAPVITAKQSLSSAKFNSANRRLLFWKEAIKVVGGTTDNVLDIVLKNRLSLINLRIATSDPGSKVVSVGAASFTESSEEASIALASGELSYSDEKVDVDISMGAQTNSSSQDKSPR